MAEVRGNRIIARTLGLVCSEQGDRPEVLITSYVCRL